MKTITLMFTVLAVLLMWPVYAFFGDEDIRSYAARVVAECANDKEHEKELCYEREIPKLMDQGLTMDKVFELAAEVQQLDSAYKYCHVLAHNISAKETAKDLSKWKDVIARAPSGVCGNGALHGAFQERFRSESLPDAPIDQILSMIDGACEVRPSWNPTFLERASCMHGLGHLTMYITEANIERSIAICEAAAKPSDGDFRRTCVDGIFMQIFQPLEPEDVSLVEKIKPADDEALAFCRQFSGLAFTSCIKESWPTHGGALDTPEGFSAACAPLSSSPEEFRYCAGGLVYVAFGRFGYDTEKMGRLCSGLQGLLNEFCYSRMASRFIETDWKNIPHALDVCSATPEDSKQECYEELIRFAEQGLHKGSREAEALCGGMPEPWNAECKKRNL